MDDTIENLRSGFKWYHVVGMAALMLVAAPPFSIRLAVGQDGATLTVERPAAGQPPGPATSAKVIATVPAEASSTSQASEAIAASKGVADGASADVSAEASTATSNEDETDLAEVSEEDIFVGDSTASEVPESAGGVNALSELETGGVPAQGEESGSPVELSVAPGSEPLLPADRPAWIGADPDLSGEIHRLFVGSAASADEGDLELMLDVALVGAVESYLDRDLFKEAGAADAIQLDANYIRKNYLQADSVKTLRLNTTPMPMFERWVTLEITPEQREQLSVWHAESLQRKRIAPVAGGLLAVIGLVGLTHIVFRRRATVTSTQPLVGEDIVAQPAVVAARKQKSSAWSFLLILFGVLVLPAMLFLFVSSLFLVGFKERETREARLTQEIHSEVLRTLSDRDVEPMRVEGQPIGVVPTGSDELERREWKFESNGQNIIIRKK